jgi:hypothetical protein
MRPLKRADRIDANDPGCVKTLRGIIAPGILGSVVMWRAKKRKNLSSARHYDQIRFRFRTTKTHVGSGVCSAAGETMMINTPREMAASIAVGQEHSRTDPLADTATRAARPLGVVLIP